MKIKVAILDHDANYLNKLVSVLGSTYMDKIQVYSFTEKEVALDTVAKSRIDVFLATDEFALKKEEIPKGCGFAYFVESKEMAVVNEEKAICKFQKVDLIYKDILSIYAENAANFSDMGGELEGKTTIQVFTSASGGTGSSSVAAAYAINQARRGRKPLYLNLEVVGNSNSFFRAEGNGSLSDVLYAIKSKKANLSLLLESNVKCDARGVYFYDSCKVACDLLEMTKEDLKCLLHELRKVEIYDCIVLDLDFALNEFVLEAFSQAKSIIFVNDGSQISNAKLLKAMEALEILEQQKELRFVTKTAVVYNRFRNRTSTTIENEEIKVLGGIQQFEGATVEQVMEELSNVPVMGQIG